MTEALATLFEGKEVHTFEHAGEIWFPLTDLASAWGVDRKTPGNLIGRNQEIFEGMFLSEGDVTYHDVNERGLYLLMGKISADRLKNPDAKAAMIRFQRWIPELIQKYRKKEIVQTPAAPQDRLKDEMTKARLCAQETNGNLIAFQKIALGKCGMGDYAPALDTAPAIVHGETGWYNPTRLVALCNDPDLTPERLNYFLLNKGFQTRDGYLWRLTPLGTEHGREYQYEAPSGHREIRISWRISILEASGLVRHPEQATLPGARV